MKSKTLFFDESGFTGYNLLDPQQPIFIIASTDISVEQAAEILRDSFPKYRGAEFKFSNIWGSNNRSGLLRFGGHVAQARENFFVWMTDKRYAVLTKIVDFLIEPVITNAGYDFYDEGFCWKYCNYIHYGLKEFAPELYEDLIRAYQAFSRNPSEESLAMLQSQLKAMVASAKEPMKVFLEQIETGARLFHQFNDLPTFRGSDELQVTSMFATITWWRSRYKEDFAVVHDASSNFMRGKEVWDALTSKDVPPQFQRSGDGAITEFPLRVVSTTPVDSKENMSVQLCDILAGLSAKFFSPRTQNEDKDFILEVSRAGFQHLVFNGVRPTDVFPDRIPPKPLDGPDVVDRLAKIIADSKLRKKSSAG